MLLGTVWSLVPWAVDDGRRAGSALERPALTICGSGGQPPETPKPWQQGVPLQRSIGWGYQCPAPRHINQEEGWA